MKNNAFQVNITQNYKIQMLNTQYIYIYVDINRKTEK